MSNPIMRHFVADHLPEHLRAVSEPFCALAREMDEALPGCAEKSAALRKLMEAKDCAVRAALTPAPEAGARPRYVTEDEVVTIIRKLSQSDGRLTR